MSVKVNSFNVNMFAGVMRNDKDVADFIREDAIVS